jgi:hypothetical protein
MPKILQGIIFDGVILVTVLIPIVVFLFYFSRLKASPFSVLANIYLILVAGVALLGIGMYVYTTYGQPPKWDFLCFWLDGKVGISGENFYNAESYGEITLPYDPGDTFLEEIVDVGFKYPPFAMFLFLPLGLFDISQAYLLWQMVNLLLCAACIYGLWRLFLKGYGVLGLLLVAVLLLLLRPTRSTFHFAQTNLLTLLFFLMFWVNRSKSSGGIWLALCVVVKPYMAILYLYPLITRKWKMLAVAVLTLLVLTFLSFLAFGSDVFASFFNNPTSKVPSYLYVEGVNQSLLATILRLSPNQIIKEYPFLNPLYLGVSLLLSIITIWVTIKKNNNADWAVLSILFLAIIVYPASLVHYGVFLIIPVVLLLQQSGQSIKERTAIFFIILAAYSLAEYGDHIFFANLLMWIVCITLAAKPSFEKTPVSDPVLVST